MTFFQREILLFHKGIRTFSVHQLLQMQYLTTILEGLIHWSSDTTRSKLLSLLKNIKENNPKARPVYAMYLMLQFLTFI